MRFDAVRPHILVFQSACVVGGLVIFLKRVVNHCLLREHFLILFHEIVLGEVQLILRRPVSGKEMLVLYNSGV